MKLNNNDDSHNSGLNLLIYNMLLDIESHPAWVCGLKHQLQAQALRSALSHPAWVCGLKREEADKTRENKPVTPCVGVWIETALKDLASDIDRSHPAWVCGLKLLLGMLENCC